MFKRRKLKIFSKKRHFIRLIGVNFPPDINKKVQGVSISQCPYLTFVTIQKNRTSLRKSFCRQSY